jgi:hypothetical protein
MTKETRVDNISEVSGAQRADEVRFFKRISPKKAGTFPY